MRLLKRIHLLLAAFLITCSLNAQEKATSTKETVSGKINGATLVINYGSPAARAREIWGKLVPFNQVWRAGANDATTFETDKELTVEGSKLPAGKYSFFIIPNVNECVVIFNKEAKQWGAYKYNEKEDQLRVTVKQKVTQSKAEKLVYTIDKNAIVLSWDNWIVPIAVQ